MVAAPVQEVKFLIFCLTIAGLSEFLQLCYLKGMILRKYYVLIAVTYYKTRHNWLKSLTKPLGTCVYCQNFWLTILLYPVFFKIDQWIILSVGGSYISIELIKFIKHGMDR